MAMAKRIRALCGYSSSRDRTREKKKKTIDDNERHLVGMRGLRLDVKKKKKIENRKEVREKQYRPGR